MNLEKLSRDISMCKSPNVDSWLVPIADLESMIEFIRKQELALTGVQSRIGSLLLEKAGAAPFDLTCVINWLENGCDPKEAAKELRIYQGRLAAQRVAVELPPLPAAIRNAFMTLESDEDRRYSIVMKFNQRDDAFEAHEYLVRSKADQPVQQPAAVVGQEPVKMDGFTRAAALLRAIVADGDMPRIKEARTVLELLDLSIASITAPVLAAGVQGDAPCDRWDKKYAMDAHFGKDWNGATPEFLDFSAGWEAKKKHYAATMQPDSGRDAALVRAAQAAIGALEAFATQSITARICAEELSAALAAHPAPSSDALKVAVLRDSLQTARYAFSQILGYVDTGTPRAICTKQMQDIDSDLAKALQIAAHPANGAQAGLSDEQIKAIRRAAHHLEDDGHFDAAIKLDAILAAAKKGQE